MQKTSIPEVPADLKNLVVQHRVLIDQIQAEELCFCVPGHPVNSSEVFYQPDPTGPFMLRFYKGYRSAFLWENASGEWLVRPWCDIAEQAESSVRTHGTFESALSSLIGFDHNQPTASRTAQRESDAAIDEFLDHRPERMAERTTRAKGAEPRLS